LMLQGKALCKDDSSFWNPLKELWRHHLSCRLLWAVQSCTMVE
jgi:hypothetical protein